MIEEKPNRNKKLMKKHLLISIIILIFFTVASIIGAFTDSQNPTPRYTLSWASTDQMQQMYYYLLNMIVPYFSMFLGFIISGIVLEIYLLFLKLNTRIEYVGFARFKENEKIGRRYLKYILYASLFFTNIWIIILGSGEDIIGIFLNEQGFDGLYREDGSMGQFIQVPWYWIINSITTFIFAIASSISDSGLVTVKKIWDHKEFTDTERVGNVFLGIIKGYSGISVIINFFIIIRTPLGREASLLIYPLIAAVMLFPLIVAMYYFRNFSRKMIFKLVKRHYTPEIMNLRYEKIPINDYKEIYED